MTAQAEAAAHDVPPEVGRTGTGLDAWSVDPADFPAGGTVEDALRFCVRYAVLAPSGHNAQPWWFRIDDWTVTIGLDTSRGLPVVDPLDREGLISVGAALFLLRLAAARFGFTATVQMWPDPLDPEAVARLTVVDTEETTLSGPPLELFDQITHRHTSRAAFRDDSVPTTVIDRLVDDALAEGALLAPAIDYPDRHALAEVIAQADREQMADHRFRRELSAWLRTPVSSRHDGIRGYGGHHNELMATAQPIIVRTFDTGIGRAARDVELATGSPVLAVLGTSSDERSAWVAAGQALARVLLRATAAGVSVGFLDQPIEVEPLRRRVADTVGLPGIAQLLLRLGYGPVPEPQPRRALDEVLSGPPA